MGIRGTRISSFSVLLIMAVCAVVGLFSLPSLKLQYHPSVVNRSISVNFTYGSASSRSVESEVTSRLEAALGNLRNIKEINSVSRDGGGSITVSLDKNARMDDIRFETASIIRNIYPSLPKGCSYPYISVNSRGEKRTTAITFNISSQLPTREIAHYVENRMLYPLSIIDGVSDVGFYGYTPYHWVITFDEQKSRALGISASDITSAIISHFSTDIIGLSNNGGLTYTVKLRSEGETDFSGIAVKRSGSRIVHLGDIATAAYQEDEPDSYYRLNGLNTLNLVVYASSDANIIKLVKHIKSTVENIENESPAEIGISVGYDSSKSVAKELDKIYLRTLLCIAILLLFVFAASRSWRYSTVIVITLAVNILISAALYLAFGIQIHIYTLAGITVSLGIMIDNSIVMIDHWSRYSNRKILPAIMSSVLTTVAALMVIYLLPEGDRANFSDFASVIAINLIVSIIVAWLFVPALLEYLPVPVAGSKSTLKERRSAVKWNGLYEKYLKWGVSHKWVLVVIFIAAFGVPTILLPTEHYSYSLQKGYEKKSGLLNSIAQWPPYSRNRIYIDKYIGGSFALFYKNASKMKFYDNEIRQTLSIEASLPEGCNVHQLNHIMRYMENYLAKFNEIETFETRVTSYRNGSITVWFKPEYEKGGIPVRIKQSVIQMASDFGGANWSVSGFDNNSFDNHIVLDGRAYGINLEGYDFDQLMRFGEKLKEHLQTRGQVRDVEIWGTRDNESPLTEFNFNYDYRALLANDVNPYQYYSKLRSPLFNSSIISIPYENELVDVRLKSSLSDEFDIWHIEHEGTDMDGKRVKLSQVGKVSKERSGLSIRRKNQAYGIAVRFNCAARFEELIKLCREETDYMNSILPVGYRAYDDFSGWSGKRKESYFWLIMLVIASIFIICAIHFNSVRYPLSIIWLIPISFIGLFIAFGLSNVTFDQGGYAAFVMLAGITVNAGIYIVSAWRNRCCAVLGGRLSIRNYIRVFNAKVWPISLTIISTVVGLVPFLSDGPDEVFWFDFALGTISGLLFSIIAIIFYLPVFLLGKRDRRVA